MNWNILFRLLLICLLPAAVSIGMVFVERKTKFNTIPFNWQEIIIGAVFGGCAILGTELGYNIGSGIVAGLSDAGVLCAGLIFGGPAGLFASIIACMYSALQPLLHHFSIGVYTLIASSASSVLAGIFAYVVRTYMFENKRPSAGIALAIGAIMEVIRMMILFLTKLKDLDHAFEVIKVISIPMIIATALACFIPCLTLDILFEEKNSIQTRRKALTSKIQKWMLAGLVVSFAISTVFVYFAESKNANNDCDTLLDLNIEDVKNAVLDSTGNDLLKNCVLAKEAYEKNESVDLESLALVIGVDEIDVIELSNSKKPIITNSTDPDVIGYDMSLGEQSKAFNVLLKTYPGEHKTQYVQEAMPRSNPVPGTPKDNIFKFAGMTLNLGDGRDGYIQVAYKYSSFELLINAKVRGLSSNRHIGKSGLIFVADMDQKIVSSDDENTVYLSDIGYDLENCSENTKYQGSGLFSNSSEKQPAYYKYATAEYYYILSSMQVAEVTTSRDNNIYLTSFCEVIIFALLFAIIYILIKLLVVNNVTEMNKNLGEIIDGNLDVVLDIKGSNEFESLSQDINETVGTLKDFIEKEKNRLAKDLALAKSIQKNALPSVYPNDPRITVAASMDTAKEVGGDFYDFYIPKENQVNILIADVSGKGVPAAMFMMRAKTQLKSLCENLLPIEQAFTQANNELCSGNEAGMFVTSWQGNIDLQTGLMKFVNAGHNPPLVKKKDGKFEYLKSRAGFVLAGYEGFPYKAQEYQLEKGDMVLLYTDGITEATSAAEVLFGEDRLINYLNGLSDDMLKPEIILKGVIGAVNEFVGDAPQFDDETMVCFVYNGNNEE